MAKKFDAEAITTAIYELEENTKKATLAEIRDELRDWASGAWIGKGETREELEPLIAGLKAAAEFIHENYGLKD